MTDKPQNEVWRNAGAGSVFVKKLDHRGEFTRHEHVQAGAKFNITTEERRLNMEMAASPAQNMFTNGSLHPIRLIEEDEDTRELAANPNAMSDEDMELFLKSHYKTFETKLPTITNEATLARLLRHAYSDDVSVKRVQLIEEHAQMLKKRSSLEPADRSAMRPVALR